MQSLLARLLLGGGGGFSPAALFSSGAEGVWYDPSDSSTLFSDTAGTTPCAAPGAGALVDVGLMLDKSKGLVLGSELRGTGVISTVGSPGTLATFNTSTGAGSAFRLDGSNTSGVQIAVSDGRTYLVDVEQLTGTLQIRGTGPAGNQLVTNVIGRQTYRLFVSAGEDLFFVTGTNAASVTFTVHSVRELPGNHAISYNATTARPELSARVNLLTYSEQFDNAAWTKTALNTTGTPPWVNVAVAPDGTTTAEKLIEDSANAAHSLSTSLTVTNGIAYTFSCYAKKAERKYLRLVGATNFVGSVNFDLDDGSYTITAGAPTVSVVNVGNGWYRCAITVVTAATTITPNITMALTSSGTGSYQGDGTSGIFIWGADLRPANIGANVPAYQRIADQYTYDTVGFPRYLRFDGVDDGMSTPANLNLSATDKATVFAGVRKLSDAARGMAVEFGVFTTNPNGTFQVNAPDNNFTLLTYSFASQGTAFSNQTNLGGYAAPITNVVTGIGDIGADIATLRVNGGAQVQTNSTDQGTGNYSAYPLYIGSRNNSSLWFNGYLYSAIVVGSSLTAAQISSTESWINGKEGGVY